MNTLAAVTLLVDGLTAVTHLSANLQAASMAVQRAHAEGREMTDEELDTFRDLVKRSIDRLAALVN